MIFKKLENWLDHKLHKIRCRLYGHCGVKTIEVYSISKRIKNYVMVGGKFFSTHNYIEKRISGKHRCSACGCIFIDVIVKCEQFNDKPHDA
jgi:hypothetical protein